MALNDALNSRKNYHEEVPLINSDEFRKAVESRRSIRRFEASPVPEDIVRECLRLAHLAPSSSNLQPWEFWWVRNPAIKHKLAQICMGQPAATTAPELIVCLARTDTWKKNAKEVLEIMDKAGNASPSVKQYYNRLMPLLLTTGFLNLWVFVKWWIFALGGLFGPIIRFPLGRNDRKIWAIKSTAFACQNLMLAFRAHGYDTCPMEGFDEVKLRRLLQIPRRAEVVMVLSAGKRIQGGVYGPQVRLPMENFIKEI